MPKTFILLPKIFPKSCPRRVQEGMQIHNDFPLDSDALWNAKMVPCWEHVDTLDGTKFNKNRYPKQGRENDGKMQNDHKE